MRVLTTVDIAIPVIGYVVCTIVSLVGMRKVLLERGPFRDKETKRTYSAASSYAFCFTPFNIFFAVGYIQDGIMDALDLTYARPDSGHFYAKKRASCDR